MGVRGWALALHLLTVDHVLYRGLGEALELLVQLGRDAGTPLDGAALAAQLARILLEKLAHLVALPLGPGLELRRVRGDQRRGVQLRPSPLVLVDGDVPGAHPALQQPHVRSAVERRGLARACGGGRHVALAHVRGKDEAGGELLSHAQRSELSGALDALHALRAMGTVCGSEPNSGSRGLAPISTSGWAVPPPGRRSSPRITATPTRGGMLSTCSTHDAQA